MQWLPIQFIIKVHIRHSIVIKEYLQYLIIAKVKGSFYSLLEKYKKPAKIHPAPTFVNLLIHQCHEGNCYCQNCLVSTLVWSTFSMSSWVSLTLAVFLKDHSSSTDILCPKNWKQCSLGLFKRAKIKIIFCTILSFFQQAEKDEFVQGHNCCNHSIAV